MAKFILPMQEIFASDGKAYIYSTTGALIRPITVGVGPNGFYFN